MADRRKKRQPVRQGIPADLLDLIARIVGGQGGLGGFEGQLRGRPGDHPLPGFLPGEGGPLVQRPIGPPLQRPFPGMGDQVDPGFNIRPDPPGFFPGEEMGPMRPIDPGVMSSRPFPGGGGVDPGFFGGYLPREGPTGGGFPRRPMPRRPFPHPGGYPRGGGLPQRRPY